ncbi:MAG: LysM peptidoglycan-binding domain-containing protein [Saprospiraceae bacterium]
MDSKKVGFTKRFIQRSYICLLTASVFQISLQSQVPFNRLFNSGTEIVIDVLPGNDIYYCRSIDKGISIYSLAEVFQVETAQVMKVNQLNPSQPINDGKIVKIPFDKSKLLHSHPANKVNHDLLPIHYIVKPKETMYRIARGYFNMDVATLKALNKKTTEDIKIGDKLLIGYFPVLLRGKIASKTLPNKTSDKKDVEILDTEKSVDTSVHNNVKIIKYFLSDVIGMWDKTYEGNSSLFVLHNQARPGSWMDIYNPMVKTHLKAKVLGKIPTGTYQDEIELFISPSVARELGILDSRYKVNIKYEQ